MSNKPVPRPLVFLLAAVLILAVVVLIDLIAEPRWTTTLREWSAGIAAILLVTLTWQYARATDVVASATRELAAETRRQHDESFRPRLNARLGTDGALFELLIENVGAEPAVNLKLSFEKELPRPEIDPPFSQLPLFWKGSSYVPSGTRYRFVVGAAYKVLEVADDCFSLQLAYGAADGRQYREDAILDVSSFRGMRVITKPPEREIAEALKGINESLHHLRE